MRNTLPQTAAARSPRSIVKANGVEIRAEFEWEVAENGFDEADTFEVTFAASALPKEFDVGRWSTEASVEIEIRVGLPEDPEQFSGADLEQIFVGQVDEVDYAPVAGTLTVSGRDFSAKFIDTKSTEKYVNQTASQIAAKLAADAGLKPVVTATKAKVGKYYEIDHVRLQDDRTQWDLLSYLARHEGYVVYVSGRELHFEPPPELNKDPYVFAWQAGEDGGPPSGNFTELTCSRALTLASDVTVMVRSWNAKQKKSFTKKATLTNPKGKRGQEQTYTYSIAGLTAEEAQRRANAILADISKHERKFTLGGPADNLLHVTDIIELRGTGSDWDQRYFPDIITRTFNVDTGYSWTIAVKNHSVESTTTP